MLASARPSTVSKQNFLSDSTTTGSAQDAENVQCGRSSERVSLIVPARNEEGNLPRLLESLRPVQAWIELSGYSMEVIVVDDQSTDRTRDIVDEYARNYPNLRLRLVDGQPKPNDWTGKNWACHQGYLVSEGRWIAFTDADTEHLAVGWEIALKRLREEKIDLMSAVPFHRCEQLWEKVLGVFQIMILLSTAAFSRPRPRRLFAIGQFLLFNRESYEAQQGHVAIRTTLADDLELARLCLGLGGRYAAEGLTTIFKVQMYATIPDFIKGWRRIFRLGFRHASVFAVVEMYFIVAVLTANMRFHYAPIYCQLCALSSIFLLWKVQRRFGEFSVLGILLWPIGLITFVLVSGLAIYDLLTSRRYEWRGREYASSGEG